MEVSDNLTNGSLHREMLRERVRFFQTSLRRLDHTVSALEESLKQKKAAIREKRLKEEMRHQVVLNNQIKQHIASKFEKKLEKHQLYDECCEMILQLIYDISALCDKHSLIHDDSVSSNHGAASATQQQQQQDMKRMLRGKLDELVELHAVYRQHAHQCYNDDSLVNDIPTNGKASENRIAKIQDDLASSRSHRYKMLLLQQNYSTMLQQLEVYHKDLGKSWQRLQQNLDI